MLVSKQPYKHPQKPIHHNNNNTFTFTKHFPKRLDAQMLIQKRFLFCFCFCFPFELCIGPDRWHDCWHNIDFVLCLRPKKLVSSGKFGCVARYCLSYISYIGNVVLVLLNVETIIFVCDSLVLFPMCWLRLAIHVRRQSPGFGLQRLGVKHGQYLGNCAGVQRWVGAIIVAVVIISHSCCVIKFHLRHNGCVTCTDLQPARPICSHDVRSGDSLTEQHSWN